MKKLVFGKFLMLAVALFLVSACAQGKAVEPGEDAKNFSIQDLNGNATSLSEFKGKVIVLNFFATWCPPCRSEIPDFIELQKAYGPKGLEIIGVSNESPAEVKDFVNSNGINYLVLIDAGGAAGNVYGPIRAVPTTFIIGKDFKIMKHYIGARPIEVFENDIKELLK